MMKTLFLQPPSFDGFDGGAGSRYQARREIKSFWFPTWLAQPAALVPSSKLIDAPPARTTLDQVTSQIRDYELCVIHTSTPSFPSDVKVAQALKDVNPSLKIGFVGAKVAVQPKESLEQGAPIDFVARNEFDFTIKEVAEGRDWSSIDGISYRNREGVLIHNKERATLEDMDSLPFVTEVYKRDLRIEDYFIGYLMHPYVSLYTGRGCKSHCTFCLWPQTVGGHRYRVRSPEHVAAEIRYAKQVFPQTREFFFDDDTFTDNLPRAEAIAKELGKMGVTWSCNAKANVPRETLKVLKDNGLRLLLVGYESGNQKILHNIKKGMRIEVAQKFTQDCHDLGIKIHGTFILGLPGETKETIEETIKFATKINPHTIQVSLAAPYPGTFLHKQAVENGWLDEKHAELIDESGIQIAPLHYPHLSHTEIFDNVETFYKRFYFRAPKIASIVGEMVRSPQMMKRRLREGVEFFQFLRERHTTAA
jgi:hopanoid biosynthesis associated radical SAM protein HpnJ